MIIIIIIIIIINIIAIICFIGTSSVVSAERRQCREDTVILNQYASGASYAGGRSPTSDPQPLKPIHEGSTPTQEPPGNLNVNDGQDMSIVLKNPQVRGSSVGSSSMLRSNVDNLTTPREEDEEAALKLHHPHSRETDEGKTSKSTTLVNHARQTFKTAN